MKSKNTICLWFDKDALENGNFYSATFPNSEMTAVHKAPADCPSGKAGDVITVEFTVLGSPCLGLNGGPAFRHSEAFSFQIATDNQAETDRGFRTQSSRATASQRSTMSLRRVSMMSISSLCSPAGTLYLSRASERWPTTMSNSALVIPSPACVVFAERLITLHGPPVTLHTRFLVFCLNNSRVSVPIPTKYLPTFGSTNSRSSKSSTTAEMAVSPPSRS